MDDAGFFDKIGIKDCLTLVSFLYDRILRHKKSLSAFFVFSAKMEGHPLEPFLFLISFGSFLLFFSSFVLTWDG